MLSVKVLLFNPRRTVLVNVSMRRWFNPFELRLTAWQGGKTSTREEKRLPTADAGLTAWCQETSQSLGLPELARRVRVSWNARMQTTAGRAWWPDRWIELNPKLKEFEPEELWRTLKHELAHLVAYERSGRRRIDAHGPEWRAACAELGIPQEQPYHSLPLKRRRMKRNYAYTCPWCLETIRRVKKIRRPVACYPCCVKHSGGTFDSRFTLVEQKMG